MIIRKFRFFKRRKKLSDKVEPDDSIYRTAKIFLQRFISLPFLRQ